VKRRLPKGAFTQDAIEAMPLEDRMAISRLNRLERQATRKSLRQQDQ
jgi:hypothetical protein